MCTLMLKCPATGRDFFAGVHMDQENFRNLPDATMKASCPHCGTAHSWRPRDARWSAETEPVT
jgi:rRNA maturation protein Nop10